MKTAVMGVDPGTRGGVAVLDPEGAPIATFAFNPGLTVAETVDILRRAAAHLEHAGSKECFMEKVGYIRGDGGLGSFTFGRVAGIIEGALEVLGLTVHYTYPAIWQSALECLTGGQKNVSKLKAIEIFPSVKVTHAIADALLIAEFGRRRLNQAV